MEIDLVPTRKALHAVAERVISPLRVQATGHEIALQARPGGFGTPELPDGAWVGLSGTDVVRCDPDGTEHRRALTTLRAAAAHIGLDGAGALPDMPLEVDADAAVVLARAWADGEAWLAELVAAADPEEDVSEINLWPEHFDIAIELGNEAAGKRAAYGLSPGDEEHRLPYAYVAPWSPPAPGPLWNATAFRGAEVPFERLAEAPALWAACRAALRD